MTTKRDRGAPKGPRLETLQRVEEIRRLGAAGHNRADIGRRIGISTQAVAMLCVQFEIQTASKPRPKEPMGDPIEEIARFFYQRDIVTAPGRWVPWIEIAESERLARRRDVVDFLRAVHQSPSVSDFVRSWAKRYIPAKRASPGVTPRRASDLSGDKPD